MIKVRKLSIRVFLGSVGSKQNKEIRPLTIRVVYCRQKKEYVLGWKVHISNFSQEKERVVFSPTGNLKRKDLGVINRLIDQEKKEIQKTFQWLKNKHSEFNVDMLVRSLREKDDLSNVESYFSLEVNKLQLEKRYGTAGQYQSGLSSWSQFLREKGIAKIQFSGINPSLVSEYIHHLRRRDISGNTVNMYLKILRAIYNKARKDGVDVGNNSPFQNIQVRKQETLKRSLSLEDIRKIAYYDLSERVLMEQARDLFMFSFYTRGMSFVDIIHLQHNSIINNTIYYERQKTGQRLNVKIEQPLALIIDKYRCSDSPYVLPILQNKSQPNRTLYLSYRYALGSVNRLLKQLGKELDIFLPLTTYVARHSWATIAKQEGCSIAGISECLGHSSENTTQIYLRSFGHDVIDKINKKVVNCVSRDIVRNLSFNKPENHL